jgi:PRTRC genetic system protein E
MSDFFKSLHTLVKSNKSLTLMMTAEGDDQIVLTFIPTPSGDSKGDSGAPLLKPLSLTGTPAELDEGFIDAIGKYSGARLSLQEQVNAEVELLDAAKQASSKRAVKALGKANGSKSNPDDDDEGEANGSTSATAGVVPADKPAQTAEGGAGAMGNLFAEVTK